MVTSVLLVACSSSLEKAAEPAPDGAVMDEVAQQVVGAAVPGFMARIDDGGGVERTALGVADRETDRTIQAADQFQIGSIAKAFMATLCLQLVDEGKVDLDASLAEYLPAWCPTGRRSLFACCSTTPAPVRLHRRRQVLGVLGTNPERLWTEDQLLAMAFPHGPNFEPGESWG